jgi:hypothetical protein
MNKQNRRNKMQIMPNNLSQLNEAVNTMNDIEVSLDSTENTTKPNGWETAIISKRIAYKRCNINSQNMKLFVKQVGEKGYTFCPATFKPIDNNVSRKVENFEQMQFIALDFDKGISFQEVTERAKKYYLPILFAYETLSSINQNKFRVVFLHDVPITDIRLAKIILDALHIIFPKADKKCNDVSKLFFGGKKLISFDSAIPTINSESILRYLTLYFIDKHKIKRYKNKIKEFALEHKIKLTPNKSETTGIAGGLRKPP